MSIEDAGTCLSARVELRIPFHDLDPAGFVWHGRYFKYFDLARSALLDFVGYSYTEMWNSGMLWPVVDTNVRFLKPLRLNQAIGVTAYLREWELRLAVDYQIEDENKKLCTRAKTVQVPVDATTLEMKMGSPAELVDKVNQRLAARAGSSGN